MVSNNNDSVAREIFESGMHTQFLGILAGILGFVVFLLSNLSYTVHDGFGPIIKHGWPIFIAFLIVLVTFILQGLFKSWRLWSTPKAALLYIYVVFICFDIVLLGFLVKQTGGTRNSIFLPLFLLIPTICTCFCDPQGKHFWVATFFTMIVFLIVSIDGQASSQGISGLSTPEIVCLNIFNVLCICTAAMCYFRTHRLRSDYCKEQLGHDCSHLYL